MPKWFKILIIVLIAISAVAAIIFGITVATGIKLYNDAQDMTEQMDDTVGALYIDLFNSNFMAYIGNDIRGGSVKVLINKVETNNESSENKVKLEGVTTIEELDTSATYTVTESFGKNGMINKITITKN